MFEGKKVRLRAYRREDLLKAREYLNTPETAAMMRPGIPFPLRHEDEDKWYERLDPGSNREYSFAIEDKNDGTYLGGCGVHSIDAKNRHGTIGVFLGEEHTGKGYGTDALRVLICLCFEEINPG